MIITLTGLDNPFDSQEYGTPFLQFTAAINMVTIMKKIEIHEMHISVCADTFPPNSLIGSMLFS